MTDKLATLELCVENADMEVIVDIAFSSGKLYYKES